MLSAGLERALLATLLVSANQAVPVDRLVSAMWNGGAPRNARGQLHSCVSRLRRRLVAGGFSDDVIITDPTGYRASPTVSTFPVRSATSPVAKPS
jgi:DNA-binding SARP family transcriptional activator